MPRENGTGPPGQGSGTGRGAERSSGPGRGRMGGNQAGSGIGGECVCPLCGTTTPHERGIPCNTITCPKCGARMIKKQSSVFPK
jgi:hypothetical protein